MNDHEAIGDLAVGFADTVHAAAVTKAELEALLSLDPLDPRGADEALERLGHLHALVIGEIKAHVEDLESCWSLLEDCIAQHASPEDGSEESSA